MKNKIYVLWKPYLLCESLLFFFKSFPNFLVSKFRVPKSLHQRFFLICFPILNNIFECCTFNLLVTPFFLTRLFISSSCYLNLSNKDAVVIVEILRLESSYHLRLLAPPINPFKNFNIQLFLVKHFS